jgi:hypothetical protein
MQQEHWRMPGDPERQHPPHKVGVIATHQHIGSVTVLHQQNWCKGSLSIQGRKTVFAAGYILMAPAPSHCRDTAALTC